ncbi:MAG: diacylglycerol kinase family protein [Candidatus Paceibacterota bacterium]|jgi:YegS/Rv2252/BmrU family lipid kinase
MFFIINRNASQSIGCQIFLKRILPLLKKSGIAFDFRITNNQEEAQKACQEAILKGEKIIVACGGDGTVNLIGRELMGTDVALGVLPLGTSNDFAIASLGMPQNPKKALEALMSGARIQADVGLVDKLIFLNVFSIGIDADIDHLAHKHPIFRRLPFKELRYGLPMINELQNPNIRQVRIEIDGRVAFEGETFFVGVHNGKREGSYFPINLQGSISDGILNLLVIEDLPSLQERLKYVIQMTTGKLDRLPRLHTFEGKEIKIIIEDEDEDDDILSAQVDGEPIELPTNTIKISVLPKVLWVITNDH